MAQRDVPPWFSFYPYEFMADENVAAMTLTQKGAYTSLLCLQWINGSIPADTQALARLLGCTVTEMDTIWAGVGQCFKAHATDQGRLVQGRLEVERELTAGRMAAERRRQTEIRERRKVERNGNVEQTADVHGSNGVEPIGNHVSCTVLYSSNTNTSEAQKQNLQRWDEFKTLYPAHRLDEELAARAWVSREEESEAILSGLREWVKSADWTKCGGEYVKWASGFISNGIYKTKPKAAGGEKAGGPIYRKLEPPKPTE
jgi:hypothetical protein